jgi:hypothetical protein
MAEPRATATRAGLAGAGSGTLVVSLAETMPHGALRDVFLYGAPSAGIVLGAITYYIQQAALRYLQKRLVQRLRKTLEPMLADPQTSEEHKIKLRKELEKAEQAVVASEVARIKVLGRVRA